MKDKVIGLLISWAHAIQAKTGISEIYLFGSLVSREGIMFDEDKSDVDLMIIIPDEYNTYRQRRDLLASLKQDKINLENELMKLLGRNNSDEQIVSLLPVTLSEIKYDLHKSNKSPFFKVTEFMNLLTEKTIEMNQLVDITLLPEGMNRLGQVFCEVQKARNLYFNSCPIGNIPVIEFSEVGDLEKSIKRTAAMLNGFNNPSITVESDHYNLILGFDYLKTLFKELMSEDEELSKIYFWVNGKKGDLDVLSEEMILLVYELMFDRCFELINSQEESEVIAPELSLSEDFTLFLNSTGLLDKSHPDQKSLRLKDIIVNPKLELFDPSKEELPTVSTEEMLADIPSSKQILISGEDQSGKTTICKVIFEYCLNSGFIPIYMSDNGNRHGGAFEKNIEANYLLQYSGTVGWDELPKELVIPIVDDFQKAKYKKRLIKNLEAYPIHVIVADQVFDMAFNTEILTNSYQHYKLKEFSPKQVDKLITKWVEISLDSQEERIGKNGKFEKVDKYTELVERTLGKLFGEGIMPSYPFFILTIISTYELNKNSNQEISSQGHCYSALVILYLTNDGVKSDDIDSYLNYLTEFAYELHSNENVELNPELFDKFMLRYTEDYNLTIDPEELLAHLSSTNIMKKNELGNFEFCYDYLYYFFNGRYFADNIEEHEEDIDDMLNNLHVTENAHIAAFISHHTKSKALTTKLSKIANDLFNDFTEATLSKEELGFFDDQLDKIANAVLPSENDMPEAERLNRLEEKEKMEQLQLENQEKGDAELDEVEEDLMINLRRAVRTVDVLGTIMKNRSGSLKRKDLVKIFNSSIKVYLRIIGAFVEEIKKPDSQLEFVRMLESKIDEIAVSKGYKPDGDDVKKLAEVIFWNVNFEIIHGLIGKTVQSLGSDKLLDITNTVCDSLNSPSSELIRHGILMWYGKNLQISEIKTVIETDQTSDTAIKILKYQVVNHSKMHRVGFKKLQRIETELKIPSKIILRARMRAITS